MHVFPVIAGFPFFPNLGADVDTPGHPPKKNAFLRRQRVAPRGVYSPSYTCTYPGYPVDRFFL